MVDQVVQNDTPPPGQQQVVAERPRSLSQWVVFNGTRIELSLEYDPENIALDELLAGFAEEVGLHKSIKLKACAHSSGDAFDGSMKVSEVIKKLGASDTLLVCIENLPSLAESASGKSEERGAGVGVIERVFKEAVEEEKSSTDSRFLSVETAGKAVLEFEGVKHFDVVILDKRYLLIPFTNLPLLRENIKMDQNLPWINRFIGLLFGAFISIAITLKGGNPSDLFHDGKTFAVLVLLVVPVGLLLLEHRIESKEKDRVESVLGIFSTEQKPDGKSR